MTVIGILPADEPRAVAMTAAIQGGDIAALRRLLEAHPDLANMPIANNTGVARTPVLIATDWPGHFPRVATTISTRAAAGAANPGRPYPVETGFVVTIPNGQVRSAIDGTNWEGRGVTPDVATAASAALDVAREHARSALKGG